MGDLVVCKTPTRPLNAALGLRDQRSGCDRRSEKDKTKPAPTSESVGQEMTARSQTFSGTASFVLAVGKL